MLGFLDVIDTKWKSIFRSTKKERIITFIASYFLAGTLFFIYMLFRDPDTSSESMGTFTAFLLYWLALLVVPLMMTIMATTSAGLFLVFIIPFCIPAFFLWLGSRSKSRTPGITFCALSGATFALLCATGFYILAQGG